MSNRKHPRGIAPYRDGHRVYCRIAGVFRSKYFGPEKSETELEAELDLLRAELRQELRGEIPAKAERNETLAAAAPRYLKAVVALPTYKERERDIGIWVALLGHRPRHAITAVEIRAIRDKWLTVGPRLVQSFETDPATGRRRQTFTPIKEPLSASTVNHRLRALENMYTVLDGRHARNPVRDVPEAEEPEQPPRTVPTEVIRAIITKMPDSKAKARLAVLAWVGIPPATQKLLERDHIDLPGKAVWVPRRKKGKGVAGRWLPLGKDGLAAFRLFIREDAFGPFSWDTVRRCFYAACRHLKVAGVRPYDFRHALAARTLQAVRDFRTTQTLMLHASSETTARYAKAVVDPHLAEAVKAVEGSGKRRPKKSRQAGAPKPQRGKAKAGSRLHRKLHSH